MVPKLARPELRGPIARVAARVEQAIAGLSAYGRSPLWAEAVKATLTIARASSHLLRAQLVLLGSEAGGGPAEGERIERFAAGVELFHLFMLIHDDVMDNAALRRGRPTLRVALQAADPSLEWTQARDLAVVVGNLLDVLAMQHLVASGPGEARACAIVLEALCRAGSGQFHDLLGFRGLGEDDEAFRRELIDKAAYHGFAAPFAAGLCLARDDADPAPALAWGTHVGLAFQEADDLADLIGSPAELGKDSLRDLLQGRASLPLLFLRRRAQGEDRELLDGIAGRTSLEFGERARLDDLVRASGVVSDCAAWVRAELSEAARLRMSSGFGEGARQGMEAIEHGLLAHVEHIVARASADEAG